MNSVASIKDRLKNKSRETGRTLQELFTLYGLERTIYRLSVSRYKENFVLKGGIFLYALYRGDYPRRITDIDLLAQRISNAEADMRAVFSDILSQEADDPLRYDLATLNVMPITEFKEYHGVNVSVTAYLDRTKIPVSIDIGFNDLIYPEKTEMDFPITLEDNSVPLICEKLPSIADNLQGLHFTAVFNIMGSTEVDVVESGDDYLLHIKRASVPEGLLVRVIMNEDDSITRIEIMEDDKLPFRSIADYVTLYFMNDNDEDWEHNVKIPNLYCRELRLFIGKALHIPFELEGLYLGVDEWFAVLQTWKKFCETEDYSSLYREWILDNNNEFQTQPDPELLKTVWEEREYGRRMIGALEDMALCFREKYKRICMT